MSETAQLQTQTTKAPPRNSHSLLVQRKCACGGSSGLTGSCSDCDKKRLLGKPLQTKLRVNEPGDEYEQEADRIADQAIAAPAHYTFSGAPARIQRFSGQPNGSMEAAPASVDQALTSPSRPLDPSLRHDMEQRFGYEFSRVRVHSGEAAAQSARDVRARAYTVGQNIVFDVGQFAPHTLEGRRLIAHELTHVIQQEGLRSLLYRSPAARDECPPEHEEGEVNTSRTPEGHLTWDVIKPGTMTTFYSPNRLLIADFGVNWSHLKRSTKNEQMLQDWLKTFELDPTYQQFNIEGYSDCIGDDDLNKLLRIDRAKHVYELFGRSARARVKFTNAAPLDMYLTANTSVTNRALNRGVVIDWKREVELPPERVAVPTPEPEQPEVRPRPKPRGVQTVDCTSDAIETIARAYPRAIQMAKHAMDLLDSIPGEKTKELLRKYFNDDSLKAQLNAHRGFRRMWSGLNAGVTFECEEDCTDFLGREFYGLVHSFASIAVGFRIHLCNDILSGLTDDFATLVILHEASHMFDFTKREQACFDGCPESLSLWKALDNADSYAQFAEECISLRLSE